MSNKYLEKIAEQADRQEVKRPKTLQFASKGARGLGGLILGSAGGSLAGYGAGNFIARQGNPGLGGKVARGLSTAGTIGGGVAGWYSAKKHNKHVDNYLESKGL